MADFKVDLTQKPRAAGPERVPAFWNPRLLGVQFLSGPIAERIKTEFPGIAVTWNPIIERWQAWAQSNLTKIGWRLLFIHWDSQRGYVAPDERLLARLESVDGQRLRMNQLQYFERIVRERERDAERAEKQWQQDTIDAAMPSWEYSQIKNIGKGSKFSEYMS